MNDPKLQWEVRHNDCLSEMKSMRGGCVDYTFTSPPYNDSGKTQRDVEMKRHTKYRTVEYRDDWFEWQCKCIDEMLRVTRKIVFYNVQTILSNKADVYKIIGKYADKIHTVLVWYKPNAQPQHYENRMCNCYEMVLVLKCSCFDGLYCADTGYKNVIVQNINSDRRYSEIHRAVMSQRFADEMIRVFTKEGETVLDPFCGLGTTGIACVNQRRKFIGIEIDDKYCEIARKRIASDTAQYSIFDWMKV